MRKVLRQTGEWLLSHEIWINGFVVAASILMVGILPWAVAIGIGFFVLRWMLNGNPSRRTPADFGVGLMALMLPVTLWVTPSPAVTRVQVYRLLTGFLLFYSFVNWTKDRGRLRWGLWGIILVGLAITVGALFGVEWVGEKIPLIPAGIYERFSTTLADTANPNVLAGSLVIILPFAPGILLFSWDALPWRERAIAILAFTLGAGVLALTQSRSALIAFGVILGLLLVFRWRWGWLLLVVILLIGSIVLVTLDEGTRQGMIIAARGSLKIEQRVEIWSRAIFMIRDFPFTGIGIGSFGEVAELFYPFFFHDASKVAHAHNLFLQVAVDLGIPGLIAWTSVLLVTIAASWQVYHRGRKSNDRWMTGIGMGLLCSQAALIAHGLTDAVTWGMVRPAPIVWALWGFAIAARFVQTAEAGKIPFA